MTREEFLALASAQYDKLTDLQSEKTFYAYEEGFVKVWTELGGQVMQASLKKGTSIDKPKKNYCQTRFGRLELPKTYRYRSKTNGFFISPYLQNLMAIAGVSPGRRCGCLLKTNDLLNTFLGIDISESQVYRVTDFLGRITSDDVLAEIEHPQLSAQDRVYASIDGSMIQMDQGWQEVKVGRIYREDSRKTNGKKGENQVRHCLDESTYCAHLGVFTDFMPKFEASLGQYKKSEDQLVFITDGATWIQKYLTSRFPNSTHILDYYHAVEHLSDFAKLHFQKDSQRVKWMKAQEAELLDGSPSIVLENLLKLRIKAPEIDRCRKQLIEYYQNNFCRIDYRKFRSQGLAIGSGPIEAVHRTVIQKRMKRSGQRWTNNGAQAMLNLRVLRESNRWGCINQILKQVA